MTYFSFLIVQMDTKKCPFQCNSISILKFLEISIFRISVLKFLFFFHTTGTTSQISNSLPCDFLRTGNLVVLIYIDDEDARCRELWLTLYLDPMCLIPTTVLGLNFSPPCRTSLPTRSCPKEVELVFLKQSLSHVKSFTESITFMQLTGNAIKEGREPAILLPRALSGCSTTSAAYRLKEGN